MNNETVKAVLSELTKTEIKAVVKSAIKEWLDEQTLGVGRWTIRAFLASALGGMVYLILTSQGWMKS